MLTTDQARALALTYAETPHGIGVPFANLAAGTPTSYERFIESVSMAMTELGFDEHDDLRALREWAESTADPVWA